MKLFPKECLICKTGKDLHSPVRACRAKEARAMRDANAHGVPGRTDGRSLGGLHAASRESKLHRSRPAQGGRHDGSLSNAKKKVSAHALRFPQCRSAPCQQVEPNGFEHRVLSSRVRGRNEVHLVCKATEHVRGVSHEIETRLGESRNKLPKESGLRPSPASDRRGRRQDQDHDGVTDGAGKGGR